MTTQLRGGSKEFQNLQEAEGDGGWGTGAGDAEGSGKDHIVGIVCVCLRWHPISFFYATY